jgi:hypothetical protein
LFDLTYWRRLLLGPPKGSSASEASSLVRSPGLAAEEERPQLRVVEPNGQWDGVAEVGQGLVGGQF